MEYLGKRLLTKGELENEVFCRLLKRNIGLCFKVFLFHLLQCPFLYFFHFECVCVCVHAHVVCACRSACKGVLIHMAACVTLECPPQSLLHRMIFHKDLFLYFNHECSCVSTDAQGAQKGALDPLELELQ